MKNIGVEKGLTNVADYLKNQGYTVQILSENIENNIAKYDNLDVIIAADYNTNMMGFADTSTKIPVISASGLTAEEVKNMIDQKTSK
ncbi:MAG TPA: YkuS family protein [Pseudobacteroides sp.]|uniref:YkuS family protein n=1 Tax=Pseudobacteroides sp. TaxID=1968840 RepID=UPI002F92F80A